MLMEPVIRVCLAVRVRTLRKRHRTWRIAMTQPLGVPDLFRHAKATGSTKVELRLGKMADSTEQ